MSASSSASPPDRRARSSCSTRWSPPWPRRGSSSKRCPKTWRSRSRCSANSAASPSPTRSWRRTRRRIPVAACSTPLSSPERLLNVHFHKMPPELIAVELMSCGRTDAAVIDALAGRLPRYGFVPFTVMRESVGFLFNRIWAAIKRECLMVVAEGVSHSRGGRPHLAALARHGAGTVPDDGPDRPRRRARRRGALRHHPRRDPCRPAGSCRATTLTRGSSASSPAGASTTTTATDRGRPKRSHGPGVQAASRRIGAAAIHASTANTPPARDSRGPGRMGPG